MGLFTKKPEQIAQAKAKELGVAWPCYWATFKTTSNGAGKISVLLVTADEVVYGHKRIKLAGARATVDTSGNTALAQGWVVKERQDTRQCFLTIEGDQSLVIPMKPEHEAIARKAAAEINNRARVATAA